MKPPKELADRIEELLREELIERGEDPSTLDPSNIAKNMFCEVQDDYGMLYIWKDEPILHVFPEQEGDVIKWRIFTR